MVLRSAAESLYRGWSLSSLGVTTFVVLFALGFTILWCWSVWQAYFATEPDRQRMLVATAVGAGYSLFSLASNLGLTSADYLNVPARIALVLGITWAVQRATGSQAPTRFFAAVKRSRACAAVALVVLGVWAVWLGNKAIHSKPPGISQGWESKEKRFIEVIRADIPQPKTGDLWSTYAGIVEARLGIFHPVVDYIIHALGEQRELYAKHFAELQPRFAETMRRDAFIYEEWLQTTNWGFYERLITNYDVVRLSDHSMLWRRTDAPWAEPPSGSSAWTQSVGEGQQAVSVPAGPADANIAVVRVTYWLTNPRKRIPLLGNQARLLVAVEGTNSRYSVSLPPQKTSWEFPVFVKPGAPFELRFQVRGPAIGARLQVKEIAVRYLTLRPANSVFLNSGQGK